MRHFIQFMIFVVLIYWASFEGVFNKPNNKLFPCREVELFGVTGVMTVFGNEIGTQNREAILM